MAKKMSLVALAAAWMFAGCADTMMPQDQIGEGGEQQSAVESALLSNSYCIASYDARQQCEHYVTGCYSDGVAFSCQNGRCLMYGGWFDIGCIQNKTAQQCYSDADCSWLTPSWGYRAICSGGSCTTTPYNQSCDDGNPCTTGTYWLSSGICGGGTALANCCTSGSQCDDGSSYTYDYCQSNQCYHSNNVSYCYYDSQCDDGLWYTTDRCVYNACQHTNTQNYCTSSSQCVSWYGSGYYCDGYGACKYGGGSSSGGFSVNVTYSATLAVSKMSLEGVWCEHGVTVVNGNVICNGNRDGDWPDRGSKSWPGGNATWSLNKPFNTNDACFAFTLPMSCSTTSCQGMTNVFSSPGGPSAMFSVKPYQGGSRLKLFAFPGLNGGSIGVFCANNFQ